MSNMTDEKAHEIFKCINDVEYFIKKYVVFNSPDEGLIHPTQFNEWQQAVMVKFNTLKIIVEEKDRDVGATSLAIGKIIHAAIFGSHKAIGVFAGSVQMRDHIMQHCRIVLESLPDWLRVNTKICNKDLIQFDNDNVIKFLLIKETNIRGTTFSLVYFDEPAYDRNFNHEFIQTLLRHTNAQAIFISSESDQPSYWDKFVKYYLQGKFG